MDFEKYKKILKNINNDNTNYNGVSTVSVASNDTSSQPVEEVWKVINKTIQVPLTFESLVKGDTSSKKFHFRLNRYYDGVDLSEKNIIIRYKNAKNYVYLSEINPDEISIAETILTFEWLLEENLTVCEGVAEFQLEVYEEDENKNTIYRYQTNPCQINISHTLEGGNGSVTSDYYLDIKFLNEYIDEVTYNIASEIPPIKIENRAIIMPALKNFLVSSDTKSKAITFVINRFFDGIDLSEKTTVIKFELSDGTGDRCFVCNKSVTSYTYQFDWLIDSRVTSIPGKVTFSIEFIGYNEKKEFYCLNTLPASIFVEKGLSVDNQIAPIYPSWLQEWNIKADSYFKKYIEYLEQSKNYAEICQTSFEKIKEFTKQCESFANTSKNNADIAWKQADRAEQAYTKTSELESSVKIKKEDFDSKYGDFLKQYSNLRKKDESIEMEDFSSVLKAYMQNKAEKTHSHDVTEIKNARSQKDPITENDLSIELVEKITNGGNSGTGSDTPSGSATALINDSLNSNSKTWSSNKIYNFVKEKTDNCVEKSEFNSKVPNIFSDYYRKKLDSIEENANYFNASDLMGLPLSIFSEDNNHKTVKNSEKEKWNDKYTKAEIDNLLATIASGQNYLPPVNTLLDLNIQYPNPKRGDTVTVENDGSNNGIYTYNDSKNQWVKVANTYIPIATEILSGLMSFEDKKTLNRLADWIYNYTEPLVTVDKINGLDEKFSSELQSYMKKDILIEEKNLDPKLIEKLTTSDSGLIDDGNISENKVYSSKQTEGVINEKIDNIYSNVVTEKEASEWFQEVGFDW